jgi:hypothetical protein
VQADVLYTCKALHKVGVEVLYGQNKFDFRNASMSRDRYAYQVNQWLAKIGPVNIGLIKSLAFSYDFRLFDPTCLRGHDYLRRSQGLFGTLLRDAKKLHGLTVDLSEHQGGPYPTFIDFAVTLKALCAMPSLKVVTIDPRSAGIASLFAYYLNLRTVHNKEPARSRQVITHQTIQDGVSF